MLTFFILNKTIRNVSAKNIGVSKQKRTLNNFKRSFYTTPPYTLSFSLAIRLDCFFFPHSENIKNSSCQRCFIYGDQFNRVLVLRLARCASSDERSNLGALTLYKHTTLQKVALTAVNRCQPVLAFAMTGNHEATGSRRAMET